MLLLLTTSGDGTSDRISHRMGDEVFRFNIDQISEYQMSFAPHWWEIVNPAGRRMGSEMAKSVFFWKALSVLDETVDKYLRAEARYIFFELYSWFDDNCRKGNPPRFHEYMGKLRILSLASKFFKTPNTIYTQKLLNSGVVPFDKRVAKSLSSSSMTDGRVLFTTDVSNRNLDPNYPWFLQEKIDATFDVTCFVVRSHIFSFKRSRSNLTGIDWRADQDFSMESEEWSPMYFSQHNEDNLRALNGDLGIEWGRYDFMMNDQGELYFLEFNANGQFFFLDYKNKYGILDAVISYLNE